MMESQEEQKMPKSSRRDFMLRSATSAAGLGLMLNGNWLNFDSSALPKAAGPNDRVNLGLVSGFEAIFCSKPPRRPGRQTW